MNYSLWTAHFAPSSLYPSFPWGPAISLTEIFWRPITVFFMSNPILLPYLTDNKASLYLYRANFTQKNFTHIFSMHLKRCKVGIIETK